MIGERVLGYDVRVTWNRESLDWDATRRKRFLIVEDVRHPLSTDCMVWASAFDCRADCPGRLERRFLQYLWHDDLWSDLALLDAYALRYFVAASDAEFSFTTAAITLAICNWNDQSQAHKLRGSVVPDVLGKEWCLAGYDVSDRWFLSALTNCGHQRDQHGADAGFKAKWASQINEHHLFRSADDAHAFRLFADTDVPEHSPFYVYGLWLR